MEIDHLVYGVSDLAAGIRTIEDLLGVAPIPGGHHPDFGTHNALLGLGEKTYLEIIAIDQFLLRPVQGWPFGLAPNQEAGLQSWAIKYPLDKPSLIPAIFGKVREGSRLTNAGISLSWKLTDPWLMRYDGVLPFLIDWGETEHPAVRLPQAGVIDHMIINHPRVGEVKNILKEMDMDIDFGQSDKTIEIRVTIRKEDGVLIELT